jgi:hypothetical protein
LTRNCPKAPKRNNLIDPRESANFILHGWRPEQPVITPATQVTAFGSCFALNISNWLSARNYNILNRQGDRTSPTAKQAYVVACGEGMVNSFVIRQQFEWAWENRSFDRPLWYGYKAEEYGYDEAIRLQTKAMFDQTEVFILTFGLSEVWYDEPTGNVFWRTIPKDVYDPARHKFRVSTVEENKANVQAIYDLIRNYRPDAKIIVTLSPVPLIATFRDNACISSNSVSKAVLRVAIDEVVRAVGHEGVLYYWPSYEMVTDVFNNPYREDRRHIKTPILHYIMTLFEHSWCTEGDIPRESLTLAWARAGAAAGLFPHELNVYFQHYRPWKLRKWIERNSDTPDRGVEPAHVALARDVLKRWRAEKNAAQAASAPDGD